ncbi:MAG: T9SS type A sorting domain-containing protein [Saprospiraceae bacterium]|nr:T9SS type A sorting domain-containing protein [Saprospiraceae bacterium]
MKQSILLLTTLFNCCYSAFSQTTLLSESFETDGEGTRYTSNTYVDCTFSDFFFRTNSNPVTPSGSGCSAFFTETLTNLQGSYFWASEDIRTSTPTLNSRPPGSITFSSLNIAGYSGMSVSLYLATSGNNGTRWESADSINIQVSINSGTFVTVGRFVGDNSVGGRLRVDSNLDGIGQTTEATADQAAFAKYTFSIPYTGSTLQLRLDYDQVGGSEELAIDAIELKGTFTQLPVELSDFRVHTEGSNNILTWQTKSEINNKSFDIEHSQDGQNFKTIGSVNALGKASNYTFSDDKPVEGIHYYRLKTIDTDASFDYSKTISVRLGSDKPKIKVFPNFTEGVVFIQNEKADFNQVSVFNSVGQLVYANASTRHIDLSIMPSGIYFVQVVSNNEKVIEKIIKK